MKTRLISMNRWISFLLVLSMLASVLPTGVFATDSTTLFTDVKDGDWYSDAVQYVSDNGLMVGVDDSHFAPGSLTTRGMVVTVLHRMEGKPTVSGTGFTDVKDGAWYTEAIVWAQANGIVEGYGDGTFHPNASMTREEMMAVFYRYSQYKGNDVSSTSALTVFADSAKIQTYAEDAMSWAVAVGLIKGFPDGTIRPQDNSNRAQLATVLLRFTKGDAEYTRGEWIKLLIESCGYPYTVEGEFESYTDIASTSYQEVIESAVVYGILHPEEGEVFRTFEPVTREFAAETAVYCLGYEPNTAIECIDAAAIENPLVANQAVQSGLLKLESGYFYPGRTLTLAEGENILAVIKAEIGAAEPDEAEHDGIVFLDNVVVNDTPFDWTAEDDVLILPAEEEKPTVGQIIVFNTEKAIRVESVDTINGETQITYSTPELYEYIDYIDVQGVAEMDFSGFVPADGVTVVTNNTAPNTVMPMGFMDDFFDVPENKIDINDNVVFTAKAKITDNVDVVVDLDAAIPDVGYKFDIDFDIKPFNSEPLVNVKNAYVKLSEDISVHVEVVAHGDDTLVDDLVYPPYIELGSVPLIGADGIGIVLEIDLIFTAEGKFEVDYRVHGTLGVQVLNNKPKNICALQSSSSVGLSGALKVGPQMRLLAEVFGKDLLSFSADAGVKAGGSVYKRSTGLVCMDAGVTLFAEVNAFENCALDDWLDIALKFTIWDESNSPLQLRGHWENLSKVDECTYNNLGTIKGTVANADNRAEYIEGALIEIKENGSLETETTTRSNENGEYSVAVNSGTHLVRISADGYIPFESLETVGQSQIVYLETYLLVAGSEDSDATGNISGIISNAVNGNGISGVKLSVLKGWNMTTGAVVATSQTDASGNYSFNLPIGNYTILMECGGYITNHINVAVTSRGNNGCHGVLTPDGSGSIALGDMRVILTWDGEPSDLDSHLWGPNASGEGFYHIFWYDMEYYHDGILHAFLDTDDRSYDGPETITVYDMTPNGTYSFYVHDYTNRDDSTSKVLANSGAKIQVYMGEMLIAQYNVPTSGVGNVWHVFDFDAVTGTIKSINTFSSEDETEYVGNPYSAGSTSFVNQVSTGLTKQ